MKKHCGEIGNYFRRAADLQRWVLQCFLAA